MPRMTIDGLGFLSGLNVPSDLQVEVYGHLIALDVDLPGHADWTDLQRQSVRQEFVIYIERFPLTGDTNRVLCHCPRVLSVGVGAH